MYLQLADNGNRTGYTFVPYDESNPSAGKWVRNDLIEAAMKQQQLSEDDMLLSGFFSSLWNGIKTVAKTGIALVTGAAGGGQPVTVNIPAQPAPAPAPAPTDSGKILGMDKQTALLVGGGLVLLLLMKKK